MVVLSVSIFFLGRADRSFLKILMLPSMGKLTGNVENTLESERPQPFCALFDLPFDVQSTNLPRCF